jgi:phosphocarrier protein HPr
MQKIQLKIINQLGLHARASAKFVATASRFISKIDLIFGKHNVNGKSIMGVMMLGAKCGSIIDCVIDGPDEDELRTALETLLENKFDEEN